MVALHMYTVIYDLVSLIHCIILARLDSQACIYFALTILMAEYCSIIIMGVAKRESLVLAFVETCMWALVDAGFCTVANDSIHPYGSRALSKVCVGNSNTCVQRETFANM